MRDINTGDVLVTTNKKLNDKYGQIFKPGIIVEVLEVSTKVIHIAGSGVDIKTDNKTLKTYLDTGVLKRTKL